MLQYKSHTLAIRAACDAVFGSEFDIQDSEGMDYTNWISSKASKVNGVLISWDGLPEDEQFENYVDGSNPTEQYRVLFRVHSGRKSARELALELRSELNQNYHPYEIINDSNEVLSSHHLQFKGAVANNDEGFLITDIVLHIH